MATSLNPADYTIAWIAALPIEAEAALGMLDKRHVGHFETSRGEDYLYLAGEINSHNVIIATWPAGQIYGVGSASALANQVKIRFPNIWFALLVGVAAGLPDLNNIDPKQRKDIRLGDVLVCVPDQRSMGIVQYDLGRDTEQGFLPNARHCETPAIVRSAIGLIQLTTKRPFREGGDFARTLLEFQERQDEDQFGFPGQPCDEMYVYNYTSSATASSKRVKREPRDQKELTRVWYGAIGSGNSLMRNPKRRDYLRDKYGLIGLEMEAAGVMNTLPTGVVRGVSDYGDGHKNKLWQPYAAATAAVYARGILCAIRPRADSRTPLERLSHIEPTTVRPNSTATIPTTTVDEIEVDNATPRASSTKPSHKRSSDENVSNHREVKPTHVHENDKPELSKSDVPRKVHQQQPISVKKAANLRRTVPDKPNKVEHKQPRLHNFIDRREVNHRVKILLPWVRTNEIEVLRACGEGLQLRLQRRLMLRSHQAEVWKLPKLQKWNLSASSSTLVMSSEQTLASDLLDFAVQAIRVLRYDNIPVIWMLESPTNGQGKAKPVVEVLASLVSQTIRLRSRQHRERDFGRICEWLQVARGERDWLAILIKLLEDLPGIYILIDARLMTRSGDAPCVSTTVIGLLRKIPEKLRTRGRSTVIKILVLVASNNHVEGVPGSDNSGVSTLSLNRSSHKTVPISERRSIKAISRNRLPRSFADHAGRIAGRRR